MNAHNKCVFYCIAIGLLFSFFFSGCAPRSYLIVDYKIPPSTNVLKGLKARIQVKDLREDTDTLTPAAAQQFKGFKGRYSIAWVAENGTRTVAAERDLKGLFYETFKKRLERMDVEIVPDTDDEAPLFQVLINTFNVGLEENTWIVRMSYEANLSMDNQLVARELVSGSAERVKIIGRKGADTTLSEIFTDIINKLDIIKLFRQAELV